MLQKNGVTVAQVKSHKVGHLLDSQAITDVLPIWRATADEVRFYQVFWDNWGALAHFNRWYMFCICLLLLVFPGFHLCFPPPIHTSI